MPLRQHKECAESNEHDVPELALGTHGYRLRRIHPAKRWGAFGIFYKLRPAPLQPSYFLVETMPAASQATEANVEAASALDFAEMLRANQSMVFSLALHFLRDHSAAEEVAQDVFLRLYRKLDELESDRHVVFWLRKVTSRCCIDYVRKRGSRLNVALEDTVEPAAAERQGDPLLNRRLRQLIATLPEKPRMVMVLRYQEDLTPEEIADVLEMPVRTVKSHLHRSLGILREKIERSMGDIR
jgi:RNA polymerase sigma-70 factor (ECF subfamily)